MKVHQTFRIEPELLKKVQKQAKKENRKVGNLYETAIIDYLNKVKNEVR